MQDNFRREKELEVLLKEYERLSNEMGFHFGIQSQLKYIALLLLGAIAAAAPFLLPLFQKVNPSIPIIALLLISFLFTSLQMAYQLQILEFVFIASYIDKILRSRICKILGIEDTDQFFFSWDRYHERYSYSKDIKDTFLYNIQVYSLSFGTMAVPALLALIAGGGLFLVEWPIAINIGNFMVFFLLILDISYFVITIFCEINRIKMQKQVKYKSYMLFVQ